LVGKKLIFGKFCHRYTSLGFFVILIINFNREKEMADFDENKN